VDDERDDEGDEYFLIEGQTELTEADYVRTWSSVPEFRKLRTYAIALPCIWTVSVLTTLAMRPSDSPKDLPFVQLLPLLILTFMIGYFLFLAPRGWAKRAAADHGDGHIRFRFDPSGLHVTTKLREAKTVWAAIPRYVETAGAFIVYISSQSLLVVPKRAFAGADVDLLRSVLDQRAIAAKQGGTDAGQARAAKKSSVSPLVIWVVLVVAFFGAWQLLSANLPR
jgi:hypothetical protein